MKKALLVIAMLLVVAPVMAGTTVKVLVNPADQFTASDGNKVQPVSIAYVSTVDIRAFALDINIDSTGGAPNFQGIRGFKTGESDTRTSTGYGIFPSRFREFIVVTSPVWTDPNYNPTTAWNEPGTIDPRTGMGFPKMVVEMGTLYDGDANKPAQSGTLFTFDVNAWGSTGTYHITVAGNALRGNVVDKDGNGVTGVVYESNDVTFACSVPDVVGQTEALATAAITDAGFTLGTRTESCSSTPGIDAGDIISTTPAAGPATCDSAVDYVVSTGPCCTEIPAVLDHNAVDANAHITGVGLTVGTITSECNATYAVGKVCRQQTGCVAPGSSVWYVLSLGVLPGIPASITVPANGASGVQTITWTAGTGATSYSLESSAPSAGTTIFPLWVAIYNGTALTFTDKVGGGTWSYRVRSLNPCGYSDYRTGGNSCADVNCLTGGVAGTAERTDWMKWRYPASWCYKKQCRGDINGKKTVTFVALNDFTLFTAAFGKTDAQLIAIPGGIGADLNHKKTVTRVALNDFTIFTTYFSKADANVPDCNVAPIITGPWTYWTTP